MTRAKVAHEGVMASNLIAPPSLDLSSFLRISSLLTINHSLTATMAQRILSTDRVRLGSDTMQR
jgi:hypothetical protein